MNSLNKISRLLLNNAKSINFANISSRQMAARGKLLLTTVLHCIFTPSLIKLIPS